MHKYTRSTLLAGLTALFLSACASAPAPQAETKPAGPALSDEARAALAQAEADVKAAQAKFALWTTARDALKGAQEAAKNGDSATVIKASKEASAQAKAGIVQASYPSTEQK